MKTNTYDQYADVYAEMVERRDETNPITAALLGELGNVSGCRVLDAGCGEGHLARILAKRGAKVTAIDVSPRLVEMARTKAHGDSIEYLVADLSEPRSEYARTFDAVGGDFVLNDVPDYRGFISTLGSVTKPGGRAVLSMNNPYSYVTRKQVQDYFDSGFSDQYRGMSEAGLKVFFYHRTLQEYISAFVANGFMLCGLLDVPHTIARDNALLPAGSRFPYFMILSFVKQRET
jgi:2-polyprenyl-3-methyl-5-hydroxy-6-metoxy-1,4-benzoquinol methylase